MTTVFYGVDLSAGKNQVTFACWLPGPGRLEFGEAALDGFLALLDGQGSAWAAVAAPRGPNLGLLVQPEVRQRLGISASPGRRANRRVAEFLLLQEGIESPRTPQAGDRTPAWMQLGFSLYAALSERDFVGYPGPGQRQFLETTPQALFHGLLGRVPFERGSLEGRIQRQLALYVRDMNVPDPMEIFEEITRHRLLQGVLPLDGLLSPVQLDAAGAAYLAWLAQTHPDQVRLVGVPEEGQVAVPSPSK